MITTFGTGVLPAAITHQAAVWRRAQEMFLTRCFLNQGEGADLSKDWGDRTLAIVARELWPDDWISIDMRDIDP